MDGWRAAAGRVRLFAYLFAGLAALLVVLSASPTRSAADQPVTATASYTTPGSYTFTVPVGVTSIVVIATAAAGGNVTDVVADAGGGSSQQTFVGGEGANLTATLPVTGGEQLVVGVGGVGGSVSPGTNGASGPAGAGGIGGGGNGNVGNTNSAGGGGPSLVGTASSSPGFGLLLVAGGGGGAGAGEAGGPRLARWRAARLGGAGTHLQGGQGGSGSTSNGVSGSFGLGGQGNSGPAAGGGGGGGYFGGGGGGGGTTGGGGGGGSSFIGPGATNTQNPVPSSNPAGVTITYAAPLANESTYAVAFSDTQPQGIASRAQTLTISNPGSAPLVVSSAELGGTNASDYLLDDGCQAPVPAGGSCAIAVRFVPQAVGASSATLTLTTNALVQPPVVTLTGTGGAASATGATGPRGPAGPAGKVEVVTCHKVTKTVPRKHRKVHTSHESCTTKTITGKATFTTTPAKASERATLSRRGVVYASGGASPSGALVLRARRPLAPGSYTLTLRVRRGPRVSTTRLRVTIG